MRPLRHRRVVYALVTLVIILGQLMSPAVLLAKEPGALSSEVARLAIEERAGELAVARVSDEELSTTTEAAQSAEAQARRAPQPVAPDRVGSAASPSGTATPVSAGSHLTKATWTFTGSVILMQATPVAGAKVSLYGSDSDLQQGTLLDSKTTGSAGTWSLSTSSSYAYYNIIETDAAGSCAFETWPPAGFSQVNAHWIRGYLVSSGTYSNFTFNTEPCGTPTATTTRTATRTTTPTITSTPCVRTFSGNVFGGTPQDRSMPSGGARIQVYGSSTSSSTGTYLGEASAHATTGAYSVAVTAQYAYYWLFRYHLGYNPIGAASTSGGTVTNLAQIRFAAPACNVSLAGNDFWEAPESAATPTPTTTSTPSRQTHTIGLVTITSDSSESQSGGSTRYFGNVWLGNHFQLTGSTDQVVYDGTNLQVTGELAQRSPAASPAGGSAQSALPLLRGAFSVNPLTGKGTPGSGVTCLLTAIGGFGLGSTPNVTAVDIPAGLIEGDTSLSAIPAGMRPFSIPFHYAVAPGPAYTGTAQEIRLQIAGGDLLVPAGATLSNAVLSAPSVAYTLPAFFSAGTVQINNFALSNGGAQIQLNAGQSFSLPELKYGDGNVAKFSNCTALWQLESFTGGSRYILLVKGTLVTNIAQTATTPSITFKLVTTNGRFSIERQSNSTQLTLNFGSFSLQISNIDVDSTGIFGTGMSYIGSAGRSVGQVRINARDLIVANKPEIPLPSISLIDTNYAKILFHDLLARPGTLAASEAHIQYALYRPEDVPNAHFSETSRSTEAQESVRYGLAQQEIPEETLASAGRTYRLSGQMDLYLPENALLNYPIDPTIDSAGDLSTTLSQIDLKLASGSLRLSNVVVSKSGITSGSATFQLPAVLSSISKSLTGVGVNANGLYISSGLSFPLSNLKLGSGDVGFPLTAVNANIQLVGSGAYTTSTYKLVVTGSLGISIPGSGASASGSLTVDSAGDITGTIADFNLTVAGMGLEMSNVTISKISGTDKSMLTIGSATLRVPGGGYAALYNLTIRPEGVPNAGLTLTGGAFQLPTIEAGGATIELEGSFNKVEDGYEFWGRGFFQVEHIGRTTGCNGIEIEATVFASTTDGQPMLKIRTIQQEGAQPTGVDAYGRHLRNIPVSATETASFSLRDASITLYCSIPIADTGFFLTEVSGSVDLTDRIFVEMSATIEAGYRIPLIDVPVMTAVGTMTLAPYIPDIQPFELNIEAVLKVFVFEMQRRYARIVAGDQGLLFGAGGDVALAPPSKPWLKVGEASIDVAVWTDWGEFYLTGSGSITLGWPKGSIWEGCFKWGCCPNGKKYYLFNCWAWQVRECKACISIPPWDLILANLSCDVGRFSNDAWGFKGKGCLLGYCTGFYIDTTGDVDWGNVDQYQLATPPYLQQARRVWDARQRGETVTATAFDDAVSFTDTDDAIISVPVTTTTDVAVSLARTGDNPSVSLILPDGQEVTPSNLPSNITYTETVTYTHGSGSEGPNSISQASNVVAPAQETLDTEGLPFSEEKQAHIQAFAEANPGLVASMAQEAFDNAAVAQESAETHVRVIHAVPNSQPVDVLIGAAHTFSHVSVFQSSEYVNILPGSYIVQIVPAGATSPVLAQTTLNALIGSDYTIAFAGAAGRPQASVLIDENQGPSDPTGEASLRLVHLSPDTGAVDLRVWGEEALFSNVAFLGATDNAGVTSDLARDIEIRRSDTEALLLTLPAASFSENSAYTIFLVGLSNGQPGLQALMVQDAEPPASLRLLHAAPQQTDVDLLVDGVRIISALPFGTASHYTALEIGSHTLQVVPTGTTTPVLLETTLSLASGEEVALVLGEEAGSLVAWPWDDDNTLPAVDQARVRFGHASPDAPAVDVVLVGTSATFPALSYGQISPYATLNAGAYDMVVRRAGQAEILLTVPGVQLDPGGVHTLVLDGLSGGEPALGLVNLRDFGATTRVTIATYIIKQAQTGNWNVKLSGYADPMSQYQLSVTGAIPTPTLTDVAVASTGATSAQVSYRLAADRPGATINFYADAGRGETALALMAEEQLAQASDEPVFSGTLLHSVPNAPYDGSLQTVSVDLAGLPSGSYKIWVEIDRSDESPIRIQAESSIEITNTWQETWDANLQVATEYGEIALSWDTCPNADTEGYAIRVHTEPGKGLETYMLGDVQAGVVWTPDPTQTYFVSVIAYDHLEERQAASEEVAVTPVVAEFSLAPAAANVTLTSGTFTTVDLLVSTEWAPYPSSVGLYAVDVPAGLAVEMDEHTVIPTTSGAHLPLGLSATSALPSGTYTVTLEARGGGVIHAWAIHVTVQKPYFTLSAAPTQAQLAEGGTADVAIQVAGFFGESDPVSLELAGAPDGLIWSFSAGSAHPGESVTLSLEDTELLAGGTYSLRIAGTDGQNMYTLALPLTVDKNDFHLEAATSPWYVRTGGTAVFELEVGVHGAWSEAVTLRIDEESLPSGVTAHLFAEPPAASAQKGHAQGTEIVVQPPSRVYVQVAAAGNTPMATQLLTVVGYGGTRQRLANVPLRVQGAHPFYLPAIMK